MSTCSEGARNSMSLLPSNLPPSVHLVNENDELHLSRFTQAMGIAFARVPITVAFSSEASDIEYEHLSTQQGNELVSSYVDSNIRRAVRLNAVMVESQDASVMAIWLLPLKSMNISVNHDVQRGPIAQEFADKVTMLKKKYIGTTPGGDICPHYCLDFLGRNTAKARISGDISSILIPFQQKAQEEKMPVWLEAAQPRMIQVGRSLGYRLLDEIVIGRGTRGADGWPRAEGPGASAWAMIFDKYCDGYMGGYQE